MVGTSPGEAVPRAPSRPRWVFGYVWRGEAEGTGSASITVQEPTNMRGTRARSETRVSSTSSAGGSIAVEDTTQGQTLATGSGSTSQSLNEQRGTSRAGNTVRATGASGSNVRLAVEYAQIFGDVGAGGWASSGMPE